MGCSFRWTPFKADSTMGLNHQMSSLSCAMNEASYLERTLLIPPVVCTDSGHNSGESCVSFESLFDLELINRVVSVQLDNASQPATETTVRSKCDSDCAKTEYPCSKHPHLKRQQQGFWFSQCLRGRVNTQHLALRVQGMLGRPKPYTASTAPSLALLRSGLFYSRSLKAIARRIRRKIGGPYSSLHLRRSDKIRPPFCRPAECRMRNASTQPLALVAVLRHWLPQGATLYIGSTERTQFFQGPLASTYRLLFASNFSQLLQPLRNNYALYAVESLIFVGSELYIETFGYTRGNFMRGCFPYQSPLTFGVSYRMGCSWACHEDLHLLPPPKLSCTRDRLSRGST
ncbi:hypothetical protein AB1Y20_002667 [Prymnesium parvum]|uniref:Uncharacterized protein n=1 Tax=Prymnesium parvum TaxID=97485 RepID=A0AB34JB20_PRYPA